jgi:glycosyltransferase involved in cell wall biosynthesis
MKQEASPSLDRRGVRKAYTILHTESSLGWGGQEHRVLAEAGAMRQRGHRLLFACDPRGELHRRARRQGYPVLTLPLRGWRKFLAPFTLARFLRAEGVDFLNTHSSLDSWVGLGAWLLAGRRPRLVRTRHLSTPVKSSWPTRRLYQTPGAIITTGQTIKDLLNLRVRVPGERIFPIPTGVPLAVFSPRSRDEGLRARLQLPEGAFVFGTVSVLRSWKGHLYLLEALARLVKDGTPAYLLAVGSGPYRGLIEDKVAALNLEKWVRLPGHQEAVAPWFSLMDAVVMASYAHEGVPQAALQAMAMGKPVVGTRVGGIPEVVIDGETGLLVPPRDPEALARALARLMADPELGRCLGARARELVLARFSLEHMAQAVEAVYDALWQGRGG